ncbi:MAG TPA: 3-isopropylmalate dehydratase small subunit [bacterium]|jgi:3-isopropylmalate dehydratase small subunit
MEKIRGRVWKFGDNIDTDQIIPSKYCTTFKPEELGPYAMCGVDSGFGHRVALGDIIVAGKNFGCGSSREAAPLALKASGLSAVIANSFSRLFLRNAVNIGLRLFISPSASEGLRQGAEIEIDEILNVVRCKTTGTVYRIDPFKGIIREIIDRGGMINYVKHQLAEESKH